MNDSVHGGETGNNAAKLDKASLKTEILTSGMEVCIEQIVRFFFFCINNADGSHLWY